MNGTWLSCGLILLVAVFLSGFFSGTETGIYRVNRIKLHVRDDRRARRLSSFLADEQSALSVTLIGTNVMNYLVTAVVAFLFVHELRLSDRDSELYTTLLVTPIIFVFGEVVPKNLFQQGADRLMYGAAGGLTAARTVCAPAVWVMRIVAVRVAALVGPHADSGDERFVARRRVSAMLREGLIHAGSRQPGHVELVERVLSLSSTSVHSVMVARNRVVAIRADAGRREFLSVARKTPYSRLPLYRDNRRRIVGWVAVARLLADSSWQTVGEHVRPILSLSPRDTVAAAILRLQEQHESMAVVVDRGGLLLGIVTLKDLMEEITGELAEF